MKPILLIKSFIIAVITTLWGCSEKLPVFDYDTTWINFNIKTSADSSLYYTFIYAEDQSVGALDTVWSELIISGSAANYDRKITLTQVFDTDENMDDAQAGVHFIGFDDASTAKYYTLPAGKHTVRIPIVVRNDASLNNGNVLLVVALSESSDLEPGFKNNNRIKLVISNTFARPDNWNKQTEADIAPYSAELHQFLISVTDNAWDYDYLLTLGYIIPIPYLPYPSFPSYVAYHYTDTAIYDTQYIKQLVKRLKELLAEDNLKREQQGLPLWNITFK